VELVNVEGVWEMSLRGRKLKALFLGCVAGGTLIGAAPASASAPASLQSTEPAAAAEAKESASSTAAVRRGPYNIANLDTGRCVDLPFFDKSAKGTQVYQYDCDYTSRDNQRFWFYRVGFHKGHSGTYRRVEIRTVKDGLCLDPPGRGDNNAGTNIYVWTCGGKKDNQYFYIREFHSGAWLVNEKSLLCLDVAGHQAGNNAPLTLSHCNDDVDRWHLAPSR
jgi:hypothetical protein